MCLKICPRLGRFVWYLEYYINARKYDIISNFEQDILTELIDTRSKFHISEQSVYILPILKKL